MQMVLYASLSTKLEMYSREFVYDDCLDSEDTLSTSIIVYSVCISDSKKVGVAVGTMAVMTSSLLVVVPVRIKSLACSIIYCVSHALLADVSKVVIAVTS